MRRQRDPARLRKGCPSCAFSKVTSLNIRNCACSIQKYNMETHAMHLGLGTEAVKQIWKLQMDFLWKLHDQGRYHLLTWEPGYAAFDRVMGAETDQPYPVWFPYGDGLVVPDLRIPKGWAFFAGEPGGYLALGLGAHIAPGLNMERMGGWRALRGVGGRLGAQDTEEGKRSASRHDAGQRSSSSRVVSKHGSTIRGGSKRN